MILVVCALAAELAGFVAPSGVEVYASGIGPVEAAAGTARRLAEGPYRAVISAGIAGAMRGRALVGDAVAIGDETLARFGREDGRALALPEGARLEETVAADPQLIAQTAASDLPLLRGLTVSEVTCSDATARALGERYGTDVESMEGFAVLRACQRAGIPALEVRGISNYIGARERAEWDFTAGARAAADALDAVLVHLL